MAEANNNNRVKPTLTWTDNKVNIQCNEELVPFIKPILDVLCDFDAQTADDPVQPLRVDFFGIVRSLVDHFQPERKRSTRASGPVSNNEGLGDDYTEIESSEDEYVDEEEVEKDLRYTRRKKQRINNRARARPGNTGAQSRVEQAGPMVVACALNDTDLGQQFVSGIATTARDALVAVGVTFERSKVQVHEDVPIELATLWVRYFFEEMLGGIDKRLAEMVASLHVWNEHINAKIISGFSQAPNLVRHLAQSIHQILETDLSPAFTALRRNVWLARFAIFWDKIKQLLRTNDPDDPTVQFFRSQREGLPDQGHGIIQISLAKTIVCDELGISPETFATMLRQCALPVAVTEIFGQGGLMFLPTTKSHIFKRHTTIKQIMSLIRQADQGDIIFQFAQLCDAKIVSRIRKGQVLELAAVEYNANNRQPLVNSVATATNTPIGESRRIEEVVDE